MKAILKKKGKKVIFDSHENTADSIYEKTYLPLAVRAVVSKAYARYEAHACRMMDAVITVTPTQTAYYKSINPMTTELSNYPVFTEQYERPAFQERALVFAGGISEQWNHHLVISALEKIPQSKYVLCGSGNQYLEGLKRLPGWDKVDYKGKVPHEQVKKILSQCAIGVALLRPGRNTAGNIGTMGNTKIFEEMMAGLPVICTDFELWRLFVDEYQCGICVDPENEDAIAAAVRYLFDHPDEARSMGENGRRAVQERYNWAHEEKKLLELYRCMQA